MIGGSDASRPQPPLIEAYLQLNEVRGHLSVPVMMDLEELGDDPKISAEHAAKLREIARYIESIEDHVYEIQGLLSEAMKSLRDQITIIGPERTL
jgi:hypothetical protein